MHAAKGRRLLGEVELNECVPCPVGCGYRPGGAEVTLRMGRRGRRGGGRVASICGRQWRQDRYWRGASAPPLLFLAQSAAVAIEGVPAAGGAASVRAARPVPTGGGAGRGCSRVLRCGRTRRSGRRAGGSPSGFQPLSGSTGGSARRRLDRSSDPELGRSGQRSTGGVRQVITAGAAMAENAMAANAAASAVETATESVAAMMGETPAGCRRRNLGAGLCGSRPGCVLDVCSGCWRCAQWRRCGWSGGCWR